MQLSRATGWHPWIAQDARDIDHTPYAHRQVEMSRQEWNGSQIVEPRTLDPLMNAVDLWWRPLEPGVASTHHDAALAYEAWVLRKEGRDQTAAADAGARAYATWVRLTPQRGDVRRPWHLLEPETRALWDQVAQAVLSSSGEEDNAT